VTQTTHLHVMPMLRTRGATSPLTHTSSCQSVTTHKASLFSGHFSYFIFMSFRARVSSRDQTMLSKDFVVFLCPSKKTL